MSHAYLKITILHFNTVLSTLKKEHTWTHVLWYVSSALFYNVCSCVFSCQIKTQSTPLPCLVWAAWEMQKKWMLTDQFTRSGEGNWPTSQCVLLENNMNFGWTKCTEFKSAQKWLLGSCFVGIKCTRYNSAIIMIRGHITKPHVFSC